MANKESLYLCHMTAEEKKAYNAKYYQEHKDYWREYYGIKQKIADAEKQVNDSRKQIKQEIADTEARMASRNIENLFGGGREQERVLELIRSATGNDNIKTRDDVFNYTNKSIREIRENAVRTKQETASMLESVKVRAQKIQSIPKNIIDRGKSLVKNFISAWKLGWK